MLILDTECYSDYWLLAFLQPDTGKIRHFELHADCAFDAATVRKLMLQNTTISFNGNSYDLPMIAAALFGASNTLLKQLSDAIIKSNLPSWRICQDFGISVPKWDHIDIIDVAPGQSSLKIYGGRLNCQTMQDLPIEPSASIAPEQRATLRDYCENDLRVTKLLYNTLKPQIELREQMSAQYGMDLRSKSDAQIAETVITSELKRITGKDYKKPTIPDGQTFHYRDPKIVSFKTPELKTVFAKLLKEEFTLGANGAVKMPEWLSNTQISIGASEYQMGIGGLHSCEKSQYVAAKDGMLLADFDAKSFYPSIILQQQLAPKLMGDRFLNVYQTIVTRRLLAKTRADELQSRISFLEKEIRDATTQTKI